MQPIRTQIKLAIIQHLQASKMLLANVRVEPQGPIALQELPLITVSLDKASVITDWSALNTQGHLLEMLEQPILIKITAAGHTELEAKLEQFAAIVSQVLAQDDSLGGLIKTLHLEEGADVTISHEGEQPIGVLTMRWFALYRRQALQLNTACS